MRLNCEVGVVNRSCSASGLSGRQKPAQASLALGRKSTDKTSFHIIHSTALNKIGTDYKIIGNLNKVFTKFVNDGQATLQFKSPPNDLCIKKADPIQLKSFLSILSKILKNENIEKLNIRPLTVATAKHVAKPKSSLTILKKSDYPITKAFPFSLTNLNVNGVSLNKIDSRILKLKHLQILNLSENNIKCVPENWDEVPCLKELVLSNNHLTEIPLKFSGGSLQRSLFLLDLSFNQLTALSNHMYRLKNLRNLKANDNKIAFVTVHIGKMKNLKFLSLANNELAVLPGSLPQLKLEDLDVGNNPFNYEKTGIISDQSGVPSLKDFAAMTLKNHNITVEEADVGPHIMRYLETGQYCACSKLCYDTRVLAGVRIGLRNLARSVASTSSTQSNLPLQACFCSLTCADRFMKNPLAFY